MVNFKHHSRNSKIRTGTKFKITKMIAIIKVSIFAALMTGFIIGTSIKEKRSKKAKIEKAK